MSYPASLTGCPVRSRRFQVSPPRPAVFRRPQQPSCGAHVRPFPAAHGRGFHPLSLGSGHRGIASSTPFPCRPRLTRCRPLRRPVTRAPGLGRKRGLHPLAPFVVAPALLEARDFSSTNPVGDRIRWQRQGLGRPGVTCLGWRPLVDDILNCPRIWPGAVAGSVADAAGGSSEE